MTRIRVQPIKLRKWFPPQDTVATMVAMLCILREDLLLELYGITNEHIPRLDDNDSGYRRTYFWRNSLRTLVEVKTILSRLSFQVRFADAMAQQPEDMRTAFARMKAELDDAHKEFLKDLRDELSGHLDQNRFQIALDNIDSEEEAFFQDGEILGKIHYRFSTELLWATLLHDVPESQRQEKAEELLGRTARLSQAVKAIDDVVVCYREDRHLP